MVAQLTAEDLFGQALLPETIQRGSDRGALMTPKKPAVPTLKQIAARIQEHLMRIERETMSWAWCNASARSNGRAVLIRYRSWKCEEHPLTKPQALQYLAYLDGGGTGTHFGKENDGEG